MMTRILTIFCLAFCTMLRAASLPVSFNTTTHKIAAPLDLWTVNSAEIYNGLGLAGMSLQSPSSVSITGGSISGIIDLAIADGGTGASTAAGARTNLGLTIGADVQAYSLRLGNLGALTGGSDLLPYFNGASTWATTTLTTFGRSLIDDADAATARATLGAASTAGTLAQFGATTSAQFFGNITDETGSGSVVGSASPTFTGVASFPLATLDANGVGIGTSAGSVYGLEMARPIAGAWGLRTFNTSTSSSAYSAIVSQTDGGTLGMRTHSAAHDTWPDAALLYGNNLSGGVNFYQSTTGAPWVFWGEGTERFRVLPTGGVTIGTAAANATLQGGAANRLDLRNSTSPQAFRVYNTYSDSSNGEWGAVEWSANTLLIGTGKNGTGSTRGIYFISGNTAVWRIDPTGNLYAHVDNTYDIGQSGSLRPRNIYAASSVIAASSLQVAAGAWIGDTARSIWRSPSDGVYTVSNHAETDFDRIQYGGTSSSFPAHKRNGTTIETKLADNSGFAATQSLYDRFGSGTPEGAVTAPVGAVYHRTDGGAGTSFYVKESGTGNTGWVAK